MRARAIIAAVLLGLAVGAPAAAFGHPSHGSARDLQVGDVLIAVRDVTIRKATIAKGSKVKVIDISHNGGRPVALDLELKDGHVLHGVAYERVRDAFRPADD